MDSSTVSALFVDEEGLPICLPSYCALIDILGFTARTRISSTNGETNSLLQQLAKSVTEAADHLDAFKAGTAWDYKFFSDNVILGYPRRGEWEDAESEFGAIVYRIADYQMQMALDGFFTRGGLAFGDLHLSRHLVFGNALIDAYETERDQAIYPRIVLHTSARDKLTQQLKTYRTVASAPHRHILLVDRDGQIFLNYLTTLIPDSDILIDGALLQHKERVTAALEQYSSIDRVYQKYLWLAEYHNFFCEEFAAVPASSHGVNISAFLIEHVSESRFSGLDSIYPGVLWDG